MVTVTDETFDTDVLGCKQQVLVEFTSSECAPCAALCQALEKLEDYYAPRVKMCKADIGACRVHANALGIMSLPTLVMFVGGVAVWSLTGNQPPKKLRRAIERTPA